MNGKERIINDAVFNVAALMKSVGATQYMEDAIVASVKLMVESAYMDGRIDKVTEIIEAQNEQDKH